MPIEFYLNAAFAVTLTGISKSGFAGGLGILAVPLMSLFVAPSMALAIQIPLLILLDAANVWNYRRAWHRETLILLVPGTLLGLALGMVSFRSIPPDALRIVVGPLAVIFALQALSGRSLSAAGRPAAAFGLTALSGFAGFVAHAGGPAMKSVLLAKGLKKSEFVGTNSIYFAAMNLLKAVGYGWIGGIYSWQAVQISLFLLPCIGIGIWLGYFLHDRISQALFQRVTQVLLLVAGLKLLYDGLL